MIRPSCVALLKKLVRGGGMMADINSNLLIPNKWIDWVSVQPDGSRASDELAGKRLLYMAKSAIAGEQVLSGDDKVDYFISKYVQDIFDMKMQAKDMQVAKKATAEFTDETNKKIYEMRLMGKRSKEIAIELFGDSRKDSTIRKSKGWVDAKAEM